MKHPSYLIIAIIFDVFFYLIRKIKYHIEGLLYRTFVDRKLSSSEISNADIWFHAGFGETLALLPLLRKLHETYPSLRILLTTHDPFIVDKFLEITSKDLWFINVMGLEGYLPPLVLGKMLRMRTPLMYFHFSPQLNTVRFLVFFAMSMNIILFVENKMHKFLNPKKKFIYRRARIIFTNSMAVFDKLQRTNIKSIKLVPSLKLARTHTTPKTADITSIMRVISSNKKILMAASVRTKEYSIVFKVFSKIKKNIDNAQLVFCPRHPRRLESIANIARYHGLSYCFNSNHSNFNEIVDVVINDVMGNMDLYYHISDVVFVGGTFTATGGHNIIEPLLHGKPVIVGPRIHNIDHLIEACHPHRCVFITPTIENFIKTATDLLRNSKKAKEAAIACREQLQERGKNVADHYIDAMMPIIDAELAKRKSNIATNEAVDERLGVADRQY